ncbi:MAG: 5-bromo-4-chloroindolyl phosphate hydrolysis family protein [Pseudomonadota bacterium]
MSWWQKNRGIIAPLGSALVAALANTFGGTGLLATLAIFFFLWIVSARLLRPDPYAALFDQAEGLLVDPKLLALELRTAESRLKSIRRDSMRLTDRELRQTIGSITGSARQLITDVKAEPAEFPRVQKALGSYLGHLETVTNSLVTIQRDGAEDPDTVDRTRQTLADLAKTFEDYKRKMVEDDRLELDVRLELMERSMQRDGLKRAAQDIAERS